MTSRQLALCGMLSALATVLLLLLSATGVGTFCAPVLAMAVLLPILEELGPRAAGTAWICVSFLGLMLSPDRELSLVYLFFGWYPLLRPRIERIPSPVARLAVKVLVCNAAVAVLYGLVLRLLGLTADLEGAGRLYLAALAVMANALFLLTDRVLSRLTSLWRTRLRHRFFR